MKNKKYKHLSFEDRCVIEEFLNNHYNFTKIANRLGKDRSTIAKEVKKHRFLREKIDSNNYPCCFLTNLPMYVMVAIKLPVVKSNVLHIIMLLLIMIIKKFLLMKEVI